MSGHVPVTGEGIVGWADTDASGWIHFTAPFRWVEVVEHAFYRDAGAEPGRFPRRAVSADYTRPLTAGTRYAVELVPERVGATSITWSWSIWDGDDRSGEAAITGRFVAVHLGDDGRPAALPPSLTRSLSAPRSERPSVPLEA